MIEKLMRKFGYAKLPKAGEGQIVVGPVVRKLPVRKVKTTTGTDSATIHEGGIKPASTSEVQLKGDEQISFTGGPCADPLAQVNLCDVCRASAQDCRKAVKETDLSNTTIKCDQYK